MTGNVARAYATAVVQVLRKHFPDLTDPAVAKTAKDAVERQTLNPRDSFEFIVDDPYSARFRLKADSRDRRRVRLAYFPVVLPGSLVAARLERTVNDALEALEADR